MAVPSHLLASREDMQEQGAPRAGGRAWLSPGVLGTTIPGPWLQPHTGQGEAVGCAGHAAAYPVLGLNQTFMFLPGGFQAQTVCIESGGRQPEPREVQPPHLGLFCFTRVMGQSLQGNFRQWSDTESQQKGKNKSCFL